MQKHIVKANLLQIMDLLEIIIHMAIGPPGNYNTYDRQDKADILKYHEIAESMRNLELWKEDYSPVLNY